MGEARLSPAIDGTQERLDAVIARLDRLCDLLAPAKPAPAPKDGETIELREPEPPPKATPAARAKR